MTDVGRRAPGENKSALSPTSGIRHPRAGGFTLLELMLVVLILGVTALLVLPRLSSFGEGDLKSTARHFSGLIQYLAQEASSTRRTYRLYYNLENGAYWVTVLKESGEFAEATDPLIARRTLPRNISFEDVVTPQQGKVNRGEAFTQFYPIGVEKSWIHLKKGEGRRWTLVINSLTGRVKVYDEYVDVDETPK